MPPQRTKDVDEDGERNGTARRGPRWGPGGVCPADRPASCRAPGPLLPHAGLDPGRRGRAPGGAAQRLAQPAALRGTQLVEVVAVPDRHQRLPADDRAAAETVAADRPRAADRPSPRAG